MSNVNLVHRLIAFESSLMRLTASIAEAKTNLRKSPDSPNLRRLQLVLVETRDELNRILNVLNDPSNIP